MRSHRFITPILALTLLLVAGCSQDRFSSDPYHSSPELRDCFNPVKGAGDLEVTDTGATPLDENSLSYVVEVTNTSKTDTLIAAEIDVTLLDKNGDPLVVGSNDNTISANHELQYLAPGASEHVGFLATPSSYIKPHDIDVALTTALSPKEGYSFWLPHKEVDYPAELEASNITMKPNPKHYEYGFIITYDINNDSETTYESESGSISTDIKTLVILRDSNDKLLGAAQFGFNTRENYDGLTIPPGKSEDELYRAFPQGIPENTDKSKLEVDFVYPITWSDIDPDCAIMPY